MHTLGREAARRCRPQEGCPLLRGRLEKLALFARAPPVPSVARGVDSSRARRARQAPQVQLVWTDQPSRPAHVSGGSDSGGGSKGSRSDWAPQQHVHQQDAPTAGAALGAAGAAATPLDQAAAIELMSRIKAAHSWQQLRGIVDSNLWSMNHLHVSAVLTHMAQLHASSSSSTGSSCSSGSSSSTSSGLPFDGLLVPQVDGGGSALHTSRGGATAAATTAASSHTRLQNAVSGGLLQSPPLCSSGGDARAHFLQRLEAAVAAHVLDFEGRQLANTLWAMAKLGHRPSERWLELVLTRASAQMHTFNPQHLANTLYALMKLRYMPPPAWLEALYGAASRGLHGFGPAELSHLCYAAGKLGLRPGRELLGGVLHHSMIHMKAYDVRELALLLYGVVHMGATLHADWLRVYRKRVTVLVVESGALPGPLLERFAAQQAQPDLAALARAQLAVLGTQQKRGRRGTGKDVLGSEAAPGAAPSSRAVWVASHLPTVLCSLADLGYRPPDVFLTTLLAAIGGYSGELTPVGLTTALLSLANMRYRPHPVLFRRIWRLLIDRLDALDTQQCTIATWACATMGCEAPTRDLAAIVRNAAARLPDHSDRELLQLLEALSALEFEPSTSWLELLESDLYNRLPRMRAQEVAALPLPLAALRHKPHRLWMQRWAEALQAGLLGLGLTQIAAALYGAARLGFRPPPRLCMELLAAAAAGMAATVEQRTAAVLDPASSRKARSAWVHRKGEHPNRRIPETLSRLLWALALLDIQPQERWLVGYMACLRLVREELTGPQRGQVAWALARLRHDPGPEWAAELALWQSQLLPRRRQQQHMQELLGGSGQNGGGGRRTDPHVVLGSATGVAEAAGDVELSPSGGHSSAVMSHLSDAATLSLAPDSSSDSRSDGGDTNILILRGIHEWAARQLQDAASDTGFRRRQAVAGGR